MADIRQFIEPLQSYIDNRKSEPNRDIYWFHSPLRNDPGASLKVTYANDGTTILMCDHGEDRNDRAVNKRIIEAIGKDESWFHVGEIDRRPVQQRERHLVWIEKTLSYLEHKDIKLEKLYQYVDLEWNTAFCRARGNPKCFGYFHEESSNYFKPGIGKNPDGTIIRRDSIPAFYCPCGQERFKKALEGNDTIFVVEGEKDADNLLRYGFIAITCGSAGDWMPEVANILTGASRVRVLADNDEKSISSSKRIVRDVKRIASVEDVEMIIPMPDVDKADVSDFLEIYGIKAFRKLASFDKWNFHLWTLKKDKNGEESRKISGVYDNAIFEYLKATRSIIVVGGIPYIYRDGVYLADVCGARLKTMIRKLIFPRFIKANTIKRVYDLFISDEELQVSPDELNLQPKEWICFKNSFYDPIQKKMVKHHPKYRAINQIPYKYDPDQNVESELMEMFLQWVADDPADREMLLQFYGLCLTLDTRQQRFLILTGRGGSGKSVVLSLLIKMVGKHNTSSIPLEKLGDRFTSIGLFKKLVNCCADLEVGVLEDAAILKKSTGEDPIRAEYKGKDAIDFYSYAKNVFSTNELPLIKSEKTNGFYRRLMVLKLDKTPEKIDPFLADKLTADDCMQYLIHMSVKALERLYASGGRIAESENSKTQVAQLWRDSDTVQAFLDFATEKDPNSRIEKGVLFDAYSKYCQNEERTPLKKANFYKSVIHKGFREIRGKNDRHFLGLNWRKADGKTDGTDENDGFISVEDISLPWD